jgi:hypothetical protein
MKYFITYSAPTFNGRRVYATNAIDPQTALETFYAHVSEPTFISMRTMQGFQPNIDLDPTGLTTGEFDALEIMYCAVIDEKGNVEPVETEQEADFVTVYAHQVGGGVIALADCADWKTAEDFAKLIETLIAASKLTPQFNYRFII